MNRKLSIALFFLGATLVNILILLILLGVGMVLLSFFLRETQPGSGSTVLLILVFSLGLIGTFLIYSRLIRIFLRRGYFNKYLEKRGPNNRPIGNG